MDVSIISQQSDPPPSVSKRAASPYKDTVSASKGAPPANNGVDSNDSFYLSATPVLSQQVSNSLYGTKGDTLEMPKILNLAESGRYRSPYFLAKKSKLWLLLMELQ